jgi:hypothetical protein
MWVPKTEADIQAAIENGVLKEGTAFDAKVALPPPGKNKDLAKDISAMTVDGGVLLYGVGGKDRTRPDVREPFDRAGAAERIDQVSQTGIQEPPVIDIRDIDSEERPGKGYLAVVVGVTTSAAHAHNRRRQSVLGSRGDGESTVDGRRDRAPVRAA